MVEGPNAGARAGPRRYGVLLAVTLVLLAVQGVVRPGDVQQITVAALAGTSLLLAFRAAQVARAVFVAAVVVAGLGLIFAIVRVTVGGIDEGAARAINAAVLLLGPPAVALGVIRDLRSSGQVRVEAVMGVLSLYILVGMLFAFVYGAVDHLGGEPFFASDADATVSRCLYFSFTTLTTVGYGDFVARSDLGHTLAVFEALIGQIYLVTVVSLIVGNLGRPARRGRESPASGDAADG
jgi:Ion channel